MIVDPWFFILKELTHVMLLVELWEPSLSPASHPSFLPFLLSFWRWVLACTMSQVGVPLCLEFFLSRSHFVFTILLAKHLWKKWSQQSCRSCSSYQQVSDTTRSCSSDKQCQTQHDHAQVIKKMSNTREAPAPSQLYSLSQTNQTVARES